ncbi:MAG: hypothetical protein IPM57_06720 [Oligoflexia bacterium]|nr:hypothetical protein [Oligoflexia bacterium]
MFKKTTFLVSVGIILITLVYFISEFRKQKINPEIPPPISQQNSNTKPDPQKPIMATEATPAARTDFQNKVISETLNIRPERPDLTKLNSKTCEKELNATLLLSYRLKKVTFFFSTIHCLKNVYKFNKDLYSQYEKMVVAAAAQEKTFVFNGKTYNLSEESLIKNSK